jgi:hypothetical protein
VARYLPWITTLGWFVAISYGCQILPVDDAFVSPQVPGCDLTISPGTQISAAVAEVDIIDGSVCLRAGVYSQRVTIADASRVTVRGLGNAVIQSHVPPVAFTGVPQGVVEIVRSVGIRLENLTIANLYRGQEESLAQISRAVDCHDSRDVVIEGSTLSSWGKQPFHAEECHGGSSNFAVEISETSISGSYMIISAVYGSTVYAHDVDFMQHRRNPDGSTRPDNHSLLYGYRESLRGGPPAHIAVRDAHVTRVTGGAVVSGLLARFSLMGTIAGVGSYAHLVDHNQNFRNISVDAFTPIALTTFGDRNAVLLCGGAGRPCFPYQQLVRRLLLAPACGTARPAYFPALLERAQTFCRNGVRTMRIDATAYTYACANGVRTRETATSVLEAPTAGACAMPDELLLPPPTAPLNPIKPPDGILPRGRGVFTDALRS